MTKKGACVGIEKDGLFLAISRKHDYNLFGFIGGKVDLEDIDDYHAIRREAFEEAGIELIDLQKVDESEDETGLITSFFKAHIENDPVKSDYFQIDGEGIVKWIKPEQLIHSSPFGEYNRRMLEKHYNIVV